MGHRMGRLLKILIAMLGIGMQPVRVVSVAPTLGLAALAIMLMTLLYGRPASALPFYQEGTVVLPADITTPTPSPPATPVLLPTPVALRTYTVQLGDTLLSVALEMGIDLDDMACLIRPDFAWAQPLVIGDALAMPPPDTRCHAVQGGETLTTIAAQYGVPPDAVYALAWNRLDRQPLDAVQLAVGLHLRIPTAAPEFTGSAKAPADAPQAFLPWILHQAIDTSPFVALAVGGPGAVNPAAKSANIPANWPYGSGHFTWPLYGWLTQSYRADHRAIDVAANLGTPVTAADRGVVLRAGWNEQGYGRFVIIDHNIDYITLYAHLSEVLVGEGEVVAQGQVIGTVGSTGNSTGAHLHFEIRDFGRLTNPLELLGR